MNTETVYNHMTIREPIGSLRLLLKTIIHYMVTELEELATTEALKVSPTNRGVKVCQPCEQRSASRNSPEFLLHRSPNFR